MLRVVVASNAPSPNPKSAGYDLHLLDHFFIIIIILNSQSIMYIKFSPKVCDELQKV